MKLHQTRPRRRDGFTFIELMVAIAIILVLISLLVGAAVTALNKMDETNTRNDITTMQSGLAQFTTDFNLQGTAGGAPPSRLWLDETGQYSKPPTAGATGLTAAQLTQIGNDSLAYLKRVWPRLQFPVDWDGSGKAGDSSVVLEGEQCLVFWLGGQKTQSAGGYGMIGFSTDPTNPMSTSTTTRKGPYFQFNAQRLKPLASGGNYLYYLDTYGQLPYAYFSSGKSANSYSASVTLPNNTTVTTGYGTSDCPSLVSATGSAVLPYYQLSSSGSTTLVQFYKPDSFQIISAGKDTKFGPGGSWSASTGATGAGADDLANFYDAKLGAKQ
jgi:prepilin-type N-terminal cleavage/methylation domain-containing protein